MRFRAVIELSGKTATGIEVPPEVMANLGTGKRPPGAARPRHGTVVAASAMPGPAQRVNREFRPDRSRVPRRR